jgi:glucose-6-phosphate isomerase
VPPVTTEKGLLTSAPSFAALCTHAGSIQAQHLRDLMGDSERCGSLTTEHNGLVLDYSRQKVTEETMGLLQQLFDEQGVAAKIAGMQAGEVLNTTEERSVLHTALRAAADASVVVGGTNVVPAVHEVLVRPLCHRHRRRRRRCRR